LGEAKYTKYNKINNNLENFRGGKGGFAPIVVGLTSDSGDTRTLPRDEGAEKLHGDSTFWPSRKA